MTKIVGPGGAVFVGADQFGSVVITPCGELDRAFGSTLRTAFHQAISQRPGRIVLDLDAVTFLDSGGCNALESGCCEARAAGIPVALCGDMTSIVRRVVTVALLSPVFDPVWPTPHR